MIYSFKNFRLERCIQFSKWTKIIKKWRKLNERHSRFFPDSNITFFINVYHIVYYKNLSERLSDPEFTLQAVLFHSRLGFTSCKDRPISQLARIHRLYVSKMENYNINNKSARTFFSPYPHSASNQSMVHKSIVHHHNHHYYYYYSTTESLTHSFVRCDFIIMVITSSKEREKNGQKQLEHKLCIH